MILCLMKAITLKILDIMKILIFIFKSKKISRFKSTRILLFVEDNIISTDQNGNIIIFSISENKIIYKYNFIEKNIKMLKKN